MPFVGQVYTVDHVAPTVTINQASGQVDPTNASPINFTVIFSESVANFATGDVTISGTAGGSKTGTVTGAGTTYNVAVTGMTTSGTVIASIGAGVATDAATNGNVASTSTDHTVTWNSPGPATKLLFVQQPAASSQAGTVMPAVSVRVSNATNVTISTDNTTQITLAIAANPGGGTLSGTVTRTAVNGVAIFNDLSINRSGTPYTLTASSAPALTTATSTGFAITPGAAITLQVSGFPNPTVAGVAQSITVTAKDSLGNTASGYVGIVHFTSSDADVALPANYQFVASDVGTRTFSATLRTAGSRSITVTDTVNASITGTQAAITVNPAAANKLGFSQQPTNARHGVAIAPAITVRLLDAFGNLLSSNNSVVVTIAIGTNPGGGTLAGTKVVTVASGVATFSGLSINNNGTGYRLAVTSPSLTGATSSTFNITN